MSLICGCWRIWISSFAYGSSLNSRDRNDKPINDFITLVRKVSYGFNQRTFIFYNLGLNYNYSAFSNKLLIAQPNARIVYFDPEEHIAFFLFAFVFVSSVIYRLRRLDPTFVSA
ncbi:18259_t:CDS:1, partial [Gigaspora margarita]